MKISRRAWLLGLIAIGLCVGGYFAWARLQDGGLPVGIASGNGRIEAVEIDIATKTPGRIREILADEGDFVEAGQVLARMDTDQLEAQLRQAKAQLRRAEVAIDTTRSMVAQRESERAAAVAVISQRQAEATAAQSRAARSEQLAVRGTISRQTLDNDRAAAQGARAGVEAAKAQLAAADAAIAATRAQVVDAEAAVEASRATVEAIDADLADSVLTAPRAGRVQYRVAQPGEVLAAGGRVLNLLDLTDVSMTFFLPTAEAGRVAIGAEVRLVLDAAPDRVIPARASFVADVAQFTPKTVETEEERQKLMFRVKAQIPPELLRKYIRQVKTGLPGMAYVRVDPNVEWPADMTGKLVQ